MTFRFGVLYWTVQRWHLPVSELTSCQVSVSFSGVPPVACVRETLAHACRVRAQNTYVDIYLYVHIYERIILMCIKIYARNISIYVSSFAFKRLRYCSASFATPPYTWQSDKSLSHCILYVVCVLYVILYHINILFYF